jgi:hypothetical protein
MKREGYPGGTQVSQETQESQPANLLQHRAKAVQTHAEQLETQQGGVREEKTS